jgi:hypothetical protein
LEENISQKLLPVYFGPWEILKVIGGADGVAYRIDVPPHLKTYPVFHASKLLPYVEGTDFPHSPSMIPPSMDGGYEVERIIEHGYFSSGSRGRPQKQYKVRFRNQPLSESRWFTRTELMKTAPDVVAGYEKELRK